ncbi:MAG: NPCBM/NEW2 domain-containing protein, partial [Planctomycetales bacterium]|nr:NPCBM/NEW2 domain-containing protein [Planctomycetales bacterium]
TARVGAVEGKGSRSKVQGSRSTSLTTSHQPLATNSNPQSLIPNPLFAVRTPTAVVTDLGTEFGVEVSTEGTTASHVFRGSVKVLVLGGTAGSPGSGREVILRENESARVEKNEATGGSRLVLHGAAGDPPKFVRRLVRPLRVLDLLDVVAGGNGMGWGRERGIDPSTGMEDPVFFRPTHSGDGQYRPVAWHKLIDGVFVPNGKAGPVQLDSAGHAFGFPGTDGQVYGSIWARAAGVRPGDERETTITQYWVYEMGRGGQFMPDRRGLLGLHPNVGITFNLEAMRRAHPGAVPSSFRAVAGMGNADRVASYANCTTDLWVFVDGRLKFKRIGLRRRDGAVKVDVELGPSDRFLTLAVTDGGDGIHADWFVLGDPVLKLASIEAENSGDQSQPRTKEVNP